MKKNNRNYILHAGFAGVLFFCMIFFWIYPVSAKNEMTVIKNNGEYQYRYNEKYNGIEILKYKGKEERVSVPEKIDGKPVKIIGWYAFSRFTEKNESLKEVTLPKTVIVIRGGAFRECVKLEKAGLPSRLKELGEGVFAQCTSLQEIELPKTLTVIPKFLFSGSGLKEIVIPKNVRDIKSGAFETCWFLEKVTFQKGSRLERLESGAFAQCSELTCIHLPDSLSVIEDGVFEWCVRLKKVSVGRNSKLKEIEEMAFFECIMLEKVTIPKKVNYLGDYVFCGCEGLRQIIFKGRVPKMGKEVFEEIYPKAVFCVPVKYKTEYKKKLKKYDWFKETMRVKGVKQKI